MPGTGQASLETVVKVVCKKKLHKTEEMHMPAGSGHGVSKGSLAAYIAFRLRKAARTQAFLRVSAPF